MKKTIVILSIFIQAATTSLYAQTILPDESVPIAKIKVTQCKKIIDNIDSMQLKCDTIFTLDEDPYYRFTGIYFDEKSSLKKYCQEETVSDGSHEYITLSAYYDEKGKLVYLFCDSGSSCENNHEYYYIYNGRIVDFMLKLDCGCCDEDNDELTEEEINLIRPIVGNAFVRAARSEITFTNFIHADTLLKILKGKEYERISCTPKGEIPIEWADHLEGDYTFSKQWNYGEAIYRNEYGQLICDGLCPTESYNMLDSEGRILEDSLLRYYQLVDTTHYHYTIVIDEWQPDSLWYIHARQLSHDSIECFTEGGVSTYSSLKIHIVGNACFPSVELKSPAPDSDWTYPCLCGSLKIDNSYWKQGIMKAVFRFTFYDEFGKVKNFTLTGKIYANIRPCN